MAIIIENTIRDGSYTIDFQFSLEQSNQIVQGLDELGFEYIEIGHGQGLGVSRHSYIPKAKETDEAYIIGAKSVAKNAKIGVFFLPGIGQLDDITKAAKLGLDFIRVGVNINNYLDMLPAAKIAKQNGLWLGLNLMKSYAVKPYEFLQIVKEIDAWGLADAIYLVDSAGGMMPDEVFNYIDIARENIVTPLGFHGHNNLSLAVANSIAAAKAGAMYVDSSIQGMGRSAGNAQTEILTYLLNKEGLLNKAIDQYKMYDFSTITVEPMMSSKQGISADTINIGVSKFHTNYLPLINKAATKYAVDKRILIKNVSDVNCLDPSENLIMQVASELSKD
jgi:4-hydroxy-2-oxovalerate aldolase